MGIGPIVDPVAVRLPIDLATLVLFALTFVTALVLTRRRPSLGLAMLVVAIPYDLSRDVGPTTVTLAKVTLLGLVTGLALRRSSLATVRARPALAVGAGAVAIVFATALSIHAADARGPALRETFKALQYLAVFAASLVALRDEPAGPVVLRAFVLTVASVALLAIAQIFTGAPSGVWFSGHAIPRIAGPLEGPNQLSGFLGIGLPLVFAIALRGDASARDRSLALATLGIGGAALLLTLSRAGVSSGLAALALVAWFAPSESGARRRIALGALGAGFAGGLAALGLVVFLLTHSFSVLHAVIGHFGTTAEVEHAGGVGNRSILWHAAIALWRAHPLFGIGAGNFEFEIGRVGPAGVRTHANSLYLQALVEGGLPLFAATVGSVLTTLAVLVRGPRGGTRDGIVVAVACGLAGLAVHQIFDLLVFFPKVGDLVWTLTAIGVARIVAANAALGVAARPAARAA